MLILASASPRRAELLRAAGIEFEVRIAEIDETPLENETPYEYVARLAAAKAEAVAARSEESQVDSSNRLKDGHGDLVFLGADTTVVIDGEIAGKPIDHQDAARMLHRLSGQWHEVLTGVAVLHRGRLQVEVEQTRVRFELMTAVEIDWYVATGEPMDKAGAYGIQGYASRFIDRIEGSYSNVVGLPIHLVWRMLNLLSAG